MNAQVALNANSPRPAKASLMMSVALASVALSSVCLQQISDPKFETVVLANGRQMRIAAASSQLRLSNVVITGRAVSVVAHFR